MKIRTNYDLMYEIALAKKGMSLQHYAKTVAKYSSFGIAFVIPILATDGLTKEELLEQLIFFSKVYPTVYAATEVLLSPFEKRIAYRKLNELSGQLGNIFIDTTPEMLLEARRYKTEFKLNFEKFPPKLEEHKYIMVPVNNDWGNNERSLHQEHIIGTRDYDYSYGEPEKQKQYSYQLKRVINK